MQIQKSLWLLTKLIIACVPYSGARPQKILESFIFPEAESPYSGSAPIPIFGKECGIVSGFQDVHLSKYGQIATAPYTPPIRSDWSQAILSVNGAVRGVQFDRFGAVWLSGVEILRLTTPEPTLEGITWQVSRDITSVSPLLKSSGNMTLQIPNVVDTTYTGILHVNASIKFYCSTSTSLPLAAWKKYVRPLQNWTSPNIFNIGLTGNETQVNMVSSLPRNMRQATLEVFASGHGCEEFWYTNLPDADTPTGGCGGGAYREIEVYIDGLIAGVAYPFPVIYTGGVNPLLWRPLTGIASFDIPPYTFDLSPFLGSLNDGKTHNISLAVRNNNKAGVWYLDAVLHALLDVSAQVFYGNVSYHSDIKPPVHVNKTSSGNVSVFITRAYRKVKVIGSLVREGGDHLVFSTSHDMTAFNNNTLVGQNLQISVGWMASDTNSLLEDGTGKNQPTSLQRKVWYPYYVSDNSSQDNTTLQIGPTAINYSRVVRMQVRDKHLPEYSLAITSDINATALYNRSLTNHSLIYKQQGTSQENDILQVGSVSDPCYSRQLVAADGHTIQDKNTTETCNWKAVPQGYYVCGLTLCEQLDGMGRDARSYVPSVVWAPLPLVGGPPQSRESLLWI